MKTIPVRVRINKRIEIFANANAAKAYARKWGGEILAANEPAAIQALGSFSAPPSINPYTAALLGLPGNVTPSEFQTAWQANGNKATPLNAPAVRESLILLCQRERKFTRVSAEAFVAARCPKLFRACLRAKSGIR